MVLLGDSSVPRQFSPGDEIALRGVYRGSVCFVQSATVVSDTPNETLLALLPGAECMRSAQSARFHNGETPRYDRWADLLAGPPDLEPFAWHSNRFLIILEPEAYFATYLMWDHDSGEFSGFYVNFQVPFIRTHCGFDTFDLELDIVVPPDGQWRWKDLEAYEAGMAVGALAPEWIEGIDSCKHDVLARIEARDYPYDRTHLRWLPDSSIAPAKLPTLWHQIP